MSTPTPSTTGPATPAWHTLPAEETLPLLESSESGLTSDEARRRLDQYGPNQIRRKGKDSVLTLLWR